MNTAGLEELVKDRQPRSICGLVHPLLENRGHLRFIDL